MAASAAYSVPLLMLLTRAAVAAPLPLVTDGQSSYVIYCEAQAPASVRDAATDLQSYLTQVSGAKLALVNQPRSPMIAVGVPPAGAAQQQPLGGYTILTRGPDVFIYGPDTADGELTPQGGTSTGTANGVCEFIERFLGVRWLMPGEHGDYVPTRKTIAVPATNLSGAPFFANRRVPYTQESRPETRQWWARQRLGYSLFLNHSHNWQHFTLADFRAHPEWFAEHGGARMAPLGDRFKLCTTDGGLVREFADRAIKFFDEKPTATCYSLSPTDSAGWCECARCQALHETDPTGKLSVTPAVFDFYNRVAELVAAKHPDKLLAGYVYAQYVYPPSKPFKLAPNVFLVWAPSFDYGFTLFRPDIQAQWDSLVGQWLKVTPNIAYYDLPNCVHNELGAVNPPGRKILKWLYPRLQQAQMKGVYVYGNPAWGYAGPMNYLLAKLAWDPAADVDALFGEYITLCYAEGAPEMKQFYTLLDDATEKYSNANHSETYSLTEKRLREVYAQSFAELERLYLAAEAKITDPHAQARLAMLGANLTILHWNLRQMKALPTPETSRFFLPDREFFAFTQRWSGSLAVAPSAASAKVAGAGEKLTVQALAVPRPDAVTPFLLRGDQRVILKPAAAAPATVRFSAVTTRGRPLKYQLYNAAGGQTDQGLVSAEVPVTVPAGSDYYLLAISAGSASFALEVTGAGWALAGAVDAHGLHFLGRTTPLYFEVPAAVTSFDLCLSSDAPGETAAANLHAPDGALVASFRTVTKTVDAQVIEVAAGQAGVWKLVPTKPDAGIVDDVYIRPGDQLPGYFSLVPAQALSVTRGK